ETLPARVHIKRRAVVIVERTEALEGRAGRTQVHIAADDINYVIGIFDLLDQGSPVFSQRAPACGNGQKPNGDKPGTSPLVRPVQLPERIAIESARAGKIKGAGRGMACLTPSVAQAFTGSIPTLPSATNLLVCA